MTGMKWFIPTEANTDGGGFTWRPDDAGIKECLSNAADYTYHTAPVLYATVLSGAVEFKTKYKTG